MGEHNGDNTSVFVIGSFVCACTVRVETLPRPGESLAAQAFLLEPGGKGFNLAVACRRLGLGVNGVFAVGDDELGRLAEPAFVRAGLSPSLLVRKTEPTGAGVGFIAATGENCLAVHSGANLALSAADVADRAATVRDAAITLAQFEAGDAPIAEAFALARAAGRRTWLNPSPFRPIPPEIFGACSILCVNRVEALALAASLGAPQASSSSDDWRALADAALAHGLEALIVTLGADGAVAFLADGAALVQPAFPCVAVDTLGCGDAFGAGLVAGLAGGLSWPDALARAAVCGALAASAVGVLAALPTRGAVDATLAIESIA